METEVCAHCGALIEGEAVEFTGRVFCSDTCCEIFGNFVTEAGEPTAEELARDVGTEDLDDLDDDLDEPRDDFGLVMNDF